MRRQFFACAVRVPRSSISGRASSHWTLHAPRDVRPGASTLFSRFFLFAYCKYNIAPESSIQHIYLCPPRRRRCRRQGDRARSAANRRTPRCIYFIFFSPLFAYACPTLCDVLLGEILRDASVICLYGRARVRALEAVVHSVRCCVHVSTRYKCAHTQQQTHEQISHRACLVQSARLFSMGSC